MFVFLWVVITKFLSSVSQLWAMFAREQRSTGHHVAHRVVYMLHMQALALPVSLSCTNWFLWSHPSHSLPDVSIGSIHINHLTLMLTCSWLKLCPAILFLAEFCGMDGLKYHAATSRLALCCELFSHWPRPFCRLEVSIHSWSDDLTYEIMIVLVHVST